MKFLVKKPDSKIIQAGIVYRVKGDNTNLRNLLIEEQNNYCAYTEKYLQPLDQVDVEHFDSSKKGTVADDYYNYYAVITTANKYKKNKDYIGATFLLNRFYQDSGELNKRIGFSNNIFFEKDDNDSEARDFIDFLGLNHPKLSDERSKHVQRMKDHFSASGYTIEKIKEYFLKYKSELSFITALNIEFSYDFTGLLN
jgi:hypothetical protein